MKNYSFLIWDFNGTILDDVGAALASVNAMLARRSKAPINLNEYREYIDVPIRGFYEKVLDLEKENYENILTEFQSGYERHIQECGLTSGVTLALEKAKLKGIPQIVLSSSRTGQIERLLKKYGIAHYFDAVLGSNDLFAGSKLEYAKSFIEAHRLNPSDAVVIGDLVHDFEVAESIGAQCLLLTSGHHSRQRLEATGARVEDSLLRFIEEE